MKPLIDFTTLPYQLVWMLLGCYLVVSCFFHGARFSIFLHPSPHNGFRPGRLACHVAVQSCAQGPARRCGAIHLDDCHETNRNHAIVRLVDPAREYLWKLDTIG